MAAGGTTFVPFGSSFPDGSSFTNMTAFQAALKELYGPQKVKNLVYRNNPFFAMVRKEEDWSGQVIPFPIVYGNPQGRSHTFATAQSNQTASKITRFVLTWAQDYQVVTVTNLVALASRNDEGAFLKALKTEMDNGIQNLKNSLCGDLFRGGTGSKGQASGTFSSGVATLSDLQAITQFEVGMALEASTTDGGAAIGSPDLGYVIAVDRQAGKITVSTTQGGTAGAPGSWSGANLWLRQTGDRNAAITGLSGWLPTTAPDNTSFFGVDRSGDTTRLAGVRYDGSSQTIEEALIDAAAQIGREDGNPEVCVTNFSSYSALEKALGAKVQYVTYEHDEVGIRFKGIKIHGPNSEIAIFPDRSNPGKLAYLLDMDSWVLGSMKTVPHILTELDGLTQLRASTADASEVRIGYYAQLGCNAPGHNSPVILQA